jgi:hypothetical protein
MSTKTTETEFRLTYWQDGSINIERVDKEVVIDAAGRRRWLEGGQTKTDLGKFSARDLSALLKMLVMEFSYSFVDSIAREEEN